MNEKLILIIFAFIFLSAIVNSNLPELVFNIGKNYGVSVLSSANPVVGQALNFALNPEATLTSLGIDRINKVIPGFSEALSFVENPKSVALNKILTEVAKSNPELFREISKSLNILDKIKQATSIINDLQIKDGKIIYGELNTNKEINLNEQFEKEFKLSDGWNLKANEDGLNIILIKENAEFKFGGNIYKNLKKALFKVNKTGSILEAYIEVNDKGSILDFNKIKQFKAAPNSKLIYKDEILNVIQNDESESNYLDHIIKGMEFDIKGDEISCKECSFGEFRIFNGRLELIDKGYILNLGKIQHHDLIINIDDFNNNVLIANENVDLLDYDGNWIKQGSVKLEAKSGINSKIDLEVLGTSNIFSPIGDEKDHLLLRLEKGSEFKLNKREKLIPILNYNINKGGVFYIENNGYKIKSDKGSLGRSYPISLFSLDKKAKYQSVALVLKEDKIYPPKKFIFNSYNLVSENDQNTENLITINTHGLPVSEKIEDNAIQTIEQLQEKYEKINPNIKFTLPESVQIGYDELENSLFKEGVSPYHVYAVDTFLKNNPEAVNDFNTIEFTDINNAHVKDDTLQVGERVIDPLIGTSVRGINPLDIIQNHEYIHRKVNLAHEKELEIMMGKLNRRTISLEDYDHWYKNEDRALLFQKYNEIGLKIESKLFEDKDIIPFIKKFNEKLYKDSLPKFEEYISLNYNKNFERYLKENRGYGSISKSEIGSDEFSAIINAELEDLYSKKDDNKKNVEILEAINRKFSVSHGLEIDLNKKYKSILFDSLYQFDELYRGESNKLNDYLRNLYGVPYVYSIRDYREYTKGPGTSYYSELPSTYKEQPVEVRKFFANSFNKNVRTITRKLTQLAFDSNQMDAKEYKEVMNIGCKTPDCIEFKCVEYKLLCCQQYPNSPNCRS